jgi:hypothetical protein
MKTAMELALARIELMKDISPDSIHWQMFKDNYIEVEKKQIENAYWASYKEGQYSGDKTAEEYYNETFKNKL